MISHNPNEEAKQTPNEKWQTGTTCPYEDCSNLCFPLKDCEKTVFNRGNWSQEKHCLLTESCVQNTEINIASVQAKPAPQITLIRSGGYDGISIFALIFFSIVFIFSIIQLLNPNAQNNSYTRSSNK